MSRRGFSLNLHCRHPRLQTFSSFLDMPSNGTPNIYETMTEEIDTQAHKFGSGPTPRWTTREEWDVELSGVTQHIQWILPMQTGVCWEPTLALLCPGKEVTQGSKTRVSPLIRDYSKAFVHLLPIFDTACVRTPVVAQLKGSMTLCWTWLWVNPLVFWWTSESRHQVTVEETQEQRGRSQGLRGI